VKSFLCFLITNRPKHSMSPNIQLTRIFYLHHYMILVWFFEYFGAQGLITCANAILANDQHVRIQEIWRRGRIIFFKVIKSLNLTAHAHLAAACYRQADLYIVKLKIIGDILLRSVHNSRHAESICHVNVGTKKRREYISRAIHEIYFILSLQFFYPFLYAVNQFAAPYRAFYGLCRLSAILGQDREKKR